MIRLAANRVGQTLIVLLVIALIAFVLGAYVGDPLSALLPIDATQAQRNELIAQLNLDKPMPERFWLFLSGAFQGDFGISFRTNEPVIDLLLARLPATLELAIVSLLGFSAMVGAVGGGGLGDLGIRYGYQRFMPEMMLAVVVVLIILVQAVQSIGDRLARRLNKRIRHS